MTCFCQTYCFTRTSRNEQGILLLAALCAVWYGLYGQVVFFLAAVLLAGGFFVNQWSKKAVI
jgi:hypothetical protein